MATYFTNDFTAANGEPWPNFTRRAGAALLAPVQSNQGWNGAAAAQRDFQSDYYPSTRDYKWSLFTDWANAVTSGRWFGMAVRYTQDAQTCYWVQISSYRMSDSTLNMPHIRIYRRRSGVDTEVVTEQDISATISGADLNAGVTFQLRVETLDDRVQLKVLADDGGGMTLLYTYEDTNAARIQSGGTIAIITGSTSVNDDVVYDDVLAEDFADEAAGGAAPATGLAIMWNGSHYTEAEAIALGIAGLRAKQSYALTADGQVRDINDFHLRVLSPGDDFAIRYNDAYYCSGVVRPVSQEGMIPEGTTYEIHGPKMLCKGVVVTHPTTNQGQVQFNADPDDPEYDADLADMSPGDILTWLYDNHTEGQDGLRAHKAAPASGTVATIPAGLSGGPVIPGITISGDFAQAVEYVLSFMPQYAWRVDPETKHHYFDDRDAAGTSDVDAADEHTFIRIETRPEMNRTAVLVRGGKPEVSIETLSLSGGTLVGSWDPTHETLYEKAKSKVNRVDGSVAAFGQYVADPTYGNRIYIDPDQTGGAFAMDAGEWDGTYLSVTMTTHGVKVFQVYKNTASRLILTSVTWPGGGAETPTAGDSMFVFGNRRKQSTVEGDVEDGQNNGYWDAYRTYKDSLGRNFAEGECFRATLKIPVGADNGTLENKYQSYEVGGKIQGGQLVLDEPALLPIGLVNYLPGRNGGCGAGEAQGVGQGGLGDIEIEAPVQNTVVPYVRVPAEGFRGSAYSFDPANWNGGGEAGYGDPGVRDLLVIDDPNFQYQTEQEADYTALADALLKVFGTLAVMCEVSRTDTIEATWLGLNKKATISDTESGRTTGYESSSDLWVAECEWDFETWQTTLRIGNMVSFGGVNIQSVRQRFAENQRIKQFRDFIKRQQEILNCLKEGFQQSAGSSVPASTAICTTEVRSTGGRSVSEHIDEMWLFIEIWFDVVWDIFSFQKGGTFSFDPDTGDVFWDDGLGTTWTWNPDTGLWEDGLGGESAAPWDGNGDGVADGGSEGQLTDWITALASQLGKTLADLGSGVPDVLGPPPGTILLGDSWYYPPGVYPPTGIPLGPGDGVPGTTLGEKHASEAVLLGLSPFDLADPMGEVWQDPDGLLYRPYPNTPGTYDNGHAWVQVQQVAAGTGENGGDFNADASPRPLSASSAPSGVSIPAIKASPGTLPVGTPVYIAGYDAVDKCAQVEQADANAAGTMQAIGVVSEALTDTQAGRVVTQGLVRGIDTSAIPTAAVNSPLYVDDSGAPAGGPTGLSAVAPAARSQQIATVQEFSVTGSIVVGRVDNAAGAVNTGIHAYDGVGGAAIGAGAQLPMTVAGANTDATNYAVGVPTPGAVTVLFDGDYLITYDVSIEDVSGGTGTPMNVQGVLQQAPSGSGIWAVVVGGDCYMEISRFGTGFKVTAGGTAIVTVAGGAGIDLQIITNIIGGIGPAASVIQGSRIVVTKLR